MNKKYMQVDENIPVLVISEKLLTWFHMTSSEKASNN